LQRRVSPGRLDHAAFWRARSPAFDGWKELDGQRIATPSGYDGPMVWWPKTWLLNEGWRKRGLISMHFVPGGDE
jgi:hypothetical protein